jgi:type VI secretion system protein VasJ
MDYLSLATRPISSDQPAGSDITYDPEFEALEQEYSKLSQTDLTSSPDGDAKGQSDLAVEYGEADWRMITHLSSSILDGKCKDLRVAGYLTLGLFETEGYSGLAQGLTIFVEMTERFWSGLYPAVTRPKMRLAALSKFGLRLSDRYQARIKKEGDVSDGTLPEEFTKIQQSLERLKEIANEKFGAQVPSLLDCDKLFSGICKRLNQHSQLEPKTSTGSIETSGHQSPQELSGESISFRTPEMSAKGPSSSPSTLQYPATHGQSGSTSPLSALSSFREPSDIRRYWEQVRDSAIAFSQYSLEKDLANPFSYRWLRMVLWAKLENSETMKQIPQMGPSQQKQDYLVGLRRDERWFDLLRASERQFHDFPLWLDLQLLSTEALSRLGDSYIPALSGVKDELIFLLHRVPEIISLEYQDGTKVANGETLEWLEGLRRMLVTVTDKECVTSSISTTASDLLLLETEVSFDVRSDLSDTLAQARALLSKVSSIRQSFMIRLALAEHLLQKRQFELAHGHFVHLDRLVQRHGLDEWQPELTLRFLELFLACSRKLMRVGKSQEVDNDRLCRNLLERISSLDPELAFRLSKREE